MMSAPTARLPDAFFRLIPIIDQPIHHPGDCLPAGVTNGWMAILGQAECKHGFAVDVELQLVCRAIADTNRTRIAIPLQVVERFLYQVRRTVHAVHNLEWSGGGAGVFLDAVAQPLQERHRFVFEPQCHQCANRIRAIAHPGKPVVPVALAAQLFGQSRGGGRHKCTGRRVGHQLQADGGALYHFTPTSTIRGGA
jgi:hypothetical protein